MMQNCATSCNKGSSAEFDDLKKKFEELKKGQADILARLTKFQASNDTQAAGMSRDEANDGKKCKNVGPNRVFDLRNNDASEDACIKKCEEVDKCVAFSGIFGSFCIGCSVAFDDNHANAIAYKKADKKANEAPTTMAPTTMAPGPPSYVVAGNGKCLHNGNDPKYEYHGGSGNNCMTLCDGKSACGGYSVSSSLNCLLWMSTPLTGGGSDWGGAKCIAKSTSGEGSRDIPPPDTRRRRRYRG
jgi:hypothetical protein